MRQWSIFLWLTFLLFLVVPAFGKQKSVYDWQQSQTLHPGIQHILLELSEPRPLKINVIRVNLRQPGLQFHATPRAENWGQPMPDFPSKVIRTVRQTSRDYLLQSRRPLGEPGGLGLDMVLALNANPWTPWQSPFNHRYADGLGLLVSDGILVSYGNGTPSFIVYNDGRVNLEKTNAETDISKIQTAVSGFAIILNNGQVNGDKSLHPRTGYGLSKDRNYLFFITVDGRQPGYSEGATTKELAIWLKDFGAWDAINMDGGGSTTLVYWDSQQVTEDNPQQAVRLLSHQKDGALRRVAGNLGLYYRHNQD